MKKEMDSSSALLQGFDYADRAFVKADDTVQEESILEKYEHQHRDIGEAVYREAAFAFAGGDGSESSLMRSARRRNCSISQSFWQRMPLVITGENITF